MKVLRYMHNALITLFMALSLPIVGLLVLIAKLIRFEGFCSFKELGLIWFSTFLDVWKRADSRG